jgi:hypothetical protein
MDAIWIDSDLLRADAREVRSSSMSTDDTNLSDPIHDDVGRPAA